MRKIFVAGNWKMNTDSAKSVELVKELAQETADLGEKVDVAVYPPFVYLQSVAKALESSDIEVGAQDIYPETSGAFTGEISPLMLKDVGCSCALSGHSERRHVIGENDELIARKVAATIENQLQATLCVGEKLTERQAGETMEVVTRQIKNGLANLDREQFGSVTLAYEPVWAIGTGKTATPEQAQQVHGDIRKLLGEMYGSEVAENMRILYGGSVKPDNAAELLAEPDIDGALVGGASLKASDFLAIIKAAL